jgi:hypothetical protein
MQSAPDMKEPDRNWQAAGDLLEKGKACVGRSVDFG